VQITAKRVKERGHSTGECGIIVATRVNQTARIGVDPPRDRPSAFDQLGNRALAFPREIVQKQD
jgi:hypothetical protein